MSDEKPSPKRGEGKKPNPVQPGDLNRSNKKKAEEKAKKERQIEAVVLEGAVEQHKPGWVKRIKGYFVSGDVDSVGRYLAQDVFLPAIRNLIVDAAQEGVKRMVFGDDGPTRSRRNSRNYRYDNPTNPRRRRSSTYLPDQGPRPGRTAPARADAGDIVLSHKADAERILERLHDIIDSYEYATVADLFELLGLESHYTDNNFGWYDLPHSQVRQIRDGFLIDIPDAEPLDR